MHRQPAERRPNAAGSRRMPNRDVLRITCHDGRSVELRQPDRAGDTPTGERHRHDREGHCRKGAGCERPAGIGAEGAGGLSIGAPGSPAPPVTPHLTHSITHLFFALLGYYSPRSLALAPRSTRPHRSRSALSQDHTGYRPSPALTTRLFRPASRKAVRGSLDAQAI